MALQSPEMRDLYDLKVFVVSQLCGTEHDKPQLMVELRF